MELTEPGISALAFLQCSPQFPLNLPVFYSLSSVEELFSDGQRQLHFRHLPLEVNPQRDDGKTSFCGFAQELLDLSLMQEQFPWPGRIVIESVSLIVRADVQAAQIHFTLLHRGIAVLEAHLALAQGFDLGSNQRNPGLVGINDVIEMTRLPVGGDNFDLFDILLHT